MENYTAGNIKNCYNAWAEITSDPDILFIIKFGLKLEFKDLVPPQLHTNIPPLKKRQTLLI